MNNRRNKEQAYQPSFVKTQLGGMTLPFSANSQQIASSSQSERVSLTAPSLPPQNSTAPPLLFSSSEVSLDDFSKTLGSLSTKTTGVILQGPEDSDPESGWSFQMSQQRHIEKSQKPVSGSQFRMPMQLTNRCDFCIESDRSLKKSKETIRTLKLQLNRLEDKYIGLKKSKSLDPNALDTMDPKEVDDLKLMKDALQGRCDTLEMELSKLKKSAMREKYAYDDMKLHVEKLERQIAEMEAEKKNILSNHAAELKNRDDQVSGLQDHVNSLTQQLTKAQLEIKSLLKKCEASMTMPNLQQELENEKKEHAMTMDKNKALNSKYLELETTYNDISNKYKIMEKDKADSDAFLKSKLGELDDMTNKYNDLLKRFNELDNDHKSSKAYQKNLEDELGQRNESIESLTNRSTSLEHDLDRANQKISEHMRRMLSDSETTKKALEVAIAGSVRLCVVAPTVNVHISDKKIKLRGALSDQALKDFLTAEVLSKYSFLFKQLADDTSPDGSPLTSWIQKMLGDMQGSIEQHVNSAMEGAR